MAASEHGSTTSVARIDELVREVESLPDANARALAVELIRGVLELHASALDRIMEIVSEADATPIMEAMAADDLVSSVLNLHGLHPEDMETRIHRALDKLRGIFQARGAEVALTGIAEGVVTVRYSSARAASGAAVRELIEDAMFQAAPEITRLVVEGLTEMREPGFVPLSQLLATQGT